MNVGSIVLELCWSMHACMHACVRDNAMGNEESRNDGIRDNGWEDMIDIVLSWKCVFAKHAYITVSE